MDLNSGNSNAMEQSLSPTEDLHRKFRSLVTLTQLVSAINRDGSPTLSTFRRTINTSTQSNLSLVLHATADILVRSTEVFSVAASGSNIVVMQEQSEPADPMYVNRRREYQYEFPDGCQTSLVIGGKSHLPKEGLSGDELCQHFLNEIKHNGTLSNHISTVKHYLREHKKVVDVKDRMEHQAKFTMYLIVQCWPKMYQRITASQGYIYELSKLREDKLREASSDRKKPIPNRNNWDLAIFVVEMVESGKMEKYILGPCRRSEWRSEQFTNLVAAFSKLKEPDAPELHDYMYDVTTRVEFHRLLLATLLAYGHTLCTLKNAESTADIARICREVWHCSGLLRAIAASLMLRQHLQFCRWWLRSPNDIHVRLHEEYTGFPVSGCRNHNVDGSGCADDGGMYWDGSEQLDQVFLDWICLQVSHRLALGTLTRVFGSPVDLNATGVLEIPKVLLLAVRYPGARSVEPWKTTVTDLLSQTSNKAYSAEFVIDTIVTSTAASTNQHSVFAIFKAAHDVGKPIEITSTMHCEIALASLAKYSYYVSKEQLIDSGDLIQLLQNINQNIIAVSRRCCSVCWQLLDVMDGPIRPFGIRGCQPTLYAVELPPWLPRDAMKAMVTRFEKFLMDNIFTMMLDETRRRNINFGRISPSSGSDWDGFGL